MRLWKPACRVRNRSHHNVLTKRNVFMPPPDIKLEYSLSVHTAISARLPVITSALRTPSRSLNPARVRRPSMPVGKDGHRAPGDLSWPRRPSGRPEDARRGSNHASPKFASRDPGRHDGPDGILTYKPLRADNSHPPRFLHLLFSTLLLRRADFVPRSTANM